MRFNFPTDPDLQGRLFEVQANNDARRVEIGLIGWLFGGHAEKPGNIAGFVIVVFSIAAIAVALWLPDSERFTKKDAVTLFMGIVTLALGYVFGRNSSNSKR